MGFNGRILDETNHREKTTIKQYPNEKTNRTLNSVFSLE